MVRAERPAQVLDRLRVLVHRASVPRRPPARQRAVRADGDGLGVIGALGFGEAGEGGCEGVVGGAPVAEIGLEQADGVLGAGGLGVLGAERSAPHAQRLLVGTRGGGEVSGQAVGVPAQVVDRGRVGVVGAEDLAVARERSIEVLEGAARRAEAQGEVTAGLLELGAILRRGRRGLQLPEDRAGLLEIPRLRDQAGDVDANARRPGRAGDLVGGGRVREGAALVAEL